MNNTMDTIFAVSLLNGRYADCIDGDELEAWPGFFTEDARYVVTSYENHAAGSEMGVIYCDSKGMLQDRVLGLREANVYERQRYRHIMSMPSRAMEDEHGNVRATTSFAVYRIMRDGRTSLFVTGCYLDTLRPDAGGELKIASRIVVCDSSVFDTLLAIPL